MGAPAAATAAVALEEIVAESALEVVRVSWVGSMCFGTVLDRSRRAFCCALLATDDPAQFAFADLPAEHRQDLIIQGRAGAVAGVLAYCRPARTWHWVGWELLSRQSLDRWIKFGDPNVLRCGEGQAIHFGRIIEHAWRLDREGSRDGERCLPGRAGSTGGSPANPARSQGSVWCT